MRTFSCAVLVVGWLALVPTAGALDFRLSSVQVEEDGFRREQLLFRGDDKNDVYITLPAGWDRAAEQGSLTLTSPAETDTMVRLEKSPFPPDLAFADKGLETYRRRVLASIPPGATETQVAEQDEPLPVFHWKSHEFVVTYVFFGRAFCRSVVFVDLDARQQIMVTTAVPKMGYDRVHAIAFDVLRSWQVMAR